MTVSELMAHLAELDGSMPVFISDSGTIGIMEPDFHVEVVPNEGDETESFVVLGISESEMTRALRSFGVEGV